MFRCQKCSTVVAVNVRSTKIIVASRPRTYEPRGQDPTERRGRVPRFRRGRRVRKRKPYDKGGQGTEIVRELSVCPKCAADFAVEAEAAAEAAALEAAEAAIAQAEASETETPQLETAQLETAQLETAQLETAQLETAQLETAQLETAELVETAELGSPDPAPTTVTDE